MQSFYMCLKHCFSYFFIFCLHECCLRAASCLDHFSHSTILGLCAIFTICKTFCPNPAYEAFPEYSCVCSKDLVRAGCVSVYSFFYSFSFVLHFARHSFYFIYFFPLLLHLLLPIFFFIFIVVVGFLAVVCFIFTIIIIAIDQQHKNNKRKKKEKKRIFSTRLIYASV